MAHFETWFDLTKASASHSPESGYGSSPAGSLIVSGRVNRYRNCLLVCEDCLRSPILPALVFIFCLFFNVWEVKWLNAAFQTSNHVIFNFFFYLYHLPEIWKPMHYLKSCFIWNHNHHPFKNCICPIFICHYGCHFVVIIFIFLFFSVMTV